MSSNLLVVDLGNTNLVLGIYRGDQLVNSWRLATARERTADEYGILARQLVGDSLHASLEGAIVASVVPPLNHAMSVMVRKYFGIDPLFVEPGVKTGIAIQVDNPAEVGADRIVNCVAAHATYGGPTVVVDFGTATTFDAIAADGAYVGGAIAPGLELGLEALAARTAKLPRVQLRAPDRAIGRDTVTAIQSGALFGYQALASGLLARIRRELADLAGIEPTAVHAILTGGLSAAPWAAAIDGVDAIDPDLTLRGLGILHAEVTGGERLELGLP